MSNAFAQGNASSSTSMPSDNMTGGNTTEYYKIHKPDHPLRLPSENITGGNTTGMNMGNSPIPMTNNSK